MSSIEVLIVAGGGGGSAPYYAGGGGAGGVVHAAAYPVTAAVVYDLTCRCWWNKRQCYCWG